MYRIENPICMQKRPARIKHYFLAVACCVFFLLGLYEIIIKVIPFRKNIAIEMPKDLKEEYDPALNYINSLSKLDAHTDSLIASSPNMGVSKEAIYPIMLNSVVRKRFYHGLYTYSLGNNFVAFLATKISGRSWNEVWSADDILQSPHAFCGQQSMVEMELLIKKGYKVRSVNMQVPEYKQGHFVFEVFYDNSWHFFDPDLEPNADLLIAENRPSIDKLRTYILSNKSMLTRLYPNPKVSIDVLYGLFNNYKVGEINQLMPDRFYVYASLTKFLSNFSVLISAIFYFLFLRNINFCTPSLNILKRLRKIDKHSYTKYSSEL